MINGTVLLYGLKVALAFAAGFLPVELTTPHSVPDLIAALVAGCVTVAGYHLTPPQK